MAVTYTDVLSGISDALDVPVGTVFTAADIATSAHFAERGDLVVVDDPVVGQMRQQAPYPRMSSVRITRNCRAVGMVQGDTITWHWIGDHHDFDRVFPR